MPWSALRGADGPLPEDAVANLKFTLVDATFDGATFGATLSCGGPCNFVRLGKGGRIAALTEIFPVLLPMTFPSFEEEE